MKAECYVITIETNIESVKYANRCISSAKKIGLDINIFNAFTPRHRPLKLLEDRGIQTKRLHCRKDHSYIDSVAGCFLSHFTLWEKCIEINKPIVIFEHDAIIKNQIPSNILDGTGFNLVINIGKPSYGIFKIPEFIGINPFTSYNLIGTHAYVVKPGGALLLITQAKKSPRKGGGARATDKFLNKKKFPFLEELYPWPVVVESEFTTIQLPANKYNNGVSLDEFGKAKLI